MSVKTVFVVVALAAQMYLVNPAAMECTVWHESRGIENRTNGVHVSVVQWNPETFYWMLDMALEDPAFMHAHLYAEPDAEDTVQAVMLMAWAWRNGYEEHWSAYRYCWDIMPVRMELSQITLDN